MKFEFMSSTPGGRETKRLWILIIMAPLAVLAVFLILVSLFVGDFGFEQIEILCSVGAVLAVAYELARPKVGIVNFVVSVDYNDETAKITFKDLDLGDKRGPRTEIHNIRYSDIMAIRYETVSSLVRINAPIEFIDLVSPTKGVRSRRDYMEFVVPSDKYTKVIAPMVKKWGGTVETIG